MSRYEFEATYNEGEPEFDGKYHVAFGFDRILGYYFLTAWKEGNNNPHLPDIATQGGRDVIIESPFAEEIKGQYTNEYHLCMLDLPF